MNEVYKISAYDGDCWYFDDELSDDFFCEKCKQYIGGKPYYPKELNIKSSQIKSGFCASYDNDQLISQEVKEFFEEWGVENVRFIQVNTKPPVYSLEIGNILDVDIEKSKYEAEGNLRFKDYCNKCDRYASIVGTDIFFKDLDKIDPRQLYRTDIVFGSTSLKYPDSNQRMQKHPLWIAGKDLAKELRKRFKRLDIKKISAE